MAEEPSNGELARRLDAIHADLKEDYRELASRLDKKTSEEVFKLELDSARRDVQHATDRISAVEAARHAEAEARDREKRSRELQRAQDRRLILTALVAPVVLLLLQVYLSTKGA